MTGKEHSYPEGLLMKQPREEVAIRDRDGFARFHLAAIVDSAEDAIISKDLDGIIQSWNPGAERIFGFTRTEMIGQPMLRLLPKGNEDEELSILARLRAGEHICNFKTQRCHKDGRLILVSLTISPVRDGDGRSSVLQRLRGTSRRSAIRCSRRTH